MAGIGIIGTGWGTRVQLPAFRGAGLEVAGLAGSNREKTRKLAADLNVQAFDDWRDLVTSPDVDLVSIVTPPSEHLEMAAFALDAGRHVLSEKPTALDAAEASRMLEAARQHPDRITLIDHELRFLPAWRFARERLAEEIGDVRYAEVRYSSPSRGDRSRAWNWWSDAKRGGGVWGAVGSHFVDALRYFGQEVDHVQALLRTTIEERSDKRVTSDDFAAVNLRLRGGAVAAMTFSAVSAGPDEPSVLTIHGERGAMRFTGAEAWISRGTKPWERFAGEEMPDIPGNSMGGAFGSGTVHLAEALKRALDDGDRNALQPAATFEDGLAQQRVLDAARRSSAEGGSWQSV